MAKKPSGRLRFYVNFRRLNSITQKDRYPIPLINKLMERVNGARVFTKIDIRQGFHRIRLTKEYKDLIAFRTKYSTYKYRVMPFSLTNGPIVFQRFINLIFLDYLDKFITVYINNLLIYSKDEVKYELYVKTVLERLRQASLQALINKCEFYVKETRYLGYILSVNSVKVNPKKVSIIINQREPNTIRGVRGFLGFYNFYRRFMRDYGRIVKPLWYLTKEGTLWDQTATYQ